MFSLILNDAKNSFKNCRSSFSWTKKMRKREEFVFPHLSWATNQVKHRTIAFWRGNHLVSKNWECVRECAWVCVGVFACVCVRACAWVCVLARVNVRERERERETEWERSFFGPLMRGNFCLKPPPTKFSGEAKKIRIWGKKIAEREYFLESQRDGTACNQTVMSTWQRLAVTKKQEC